MSAVIELLPVAEGDREFLYRVYASTRTDELATVPWTDVQKDTFLRAQFDAQDRWYHENYTRTTYELIVLNGEPAGRLYVRRGETDIRIVDIALLPEHRGFGVGTWLLEALLAEADAGGKSVTIHVERTNPALRLYQRLGFAVSEDKGVYLFLERPAAT
ncbi:GNAT family N-acetyltransferase [Monashia sp. NPDC004114]